MPSYLKVLILLLVVILSLALMIMTSLYLKLKRKNSTSNKTIENKQAPFDTDTLYKESETLAFDSKQLEWKTVEMMNSFAEIREFSAKLEKTSESNLSSSEEINSSLLSFSSQNEILHQAISKINERTHDSIQILDENKKNTTEAMDELYILKDQIALAIENNNELKQFSTKIYEIISYINAISKQTSMLAINASIEAARAGSMGQGFAVVAKEIGKLSSETNQSVNTISDVVEGILSKIENTVLAMDKISSAMKNLDERLQTLDSSSNNITLEVHNIKDNMKVILDSSQKQNSDMQTIDKAVEYVVQFAESTFSTAMSQKNIIEKQQTHNSNIKDICDKINTVGENIQKFATKHKKETDVIFAINPFTEPETIKNNYLPVLRTVCHAVGYNAKIIIVKDYQSLGAAISTGLADIGWFSPLAYVDAHEKYNLSPLVTPKVGGKTNYQGYIITLKNSGIDSIENLASKTFAYVDPKSASGYLYAREQIKNSGFNPDTMFSKSEFLGSHDKVIASILDGSFDAGATYSDAYDLSRKKGLPMDKLQILAKTDNIPKDALAYGKNLEEEKISNLLKAFTEFKLSSSGITSIVDGFVESKDSDYDIIRSIR